MCGLKAKDILISIKLLNVKSFKIEGKVICSISKVKYNL
ncbi:protein of unknown function [Clostridium beijerinckii]|nr:protein of unknown function [Clostridium beijerinckii]